MDVENDLGGMDAMILCLGASGFDRRQSVVENRREDFHRLPIAFCGARELPPGRKQVHTGDTTGLFRDILANEKSTAECSSVALFSPIAPACQERQSVKELGWESGPNPK